MSIIYASVNQKKNKDGKDTIFRFLSELKIVHRNPDYFYCDRNKPQYDIIIDVPTTTEKTKKKHSNV